MEIPYRFQISQGEEGLTREVRVGTLEAAEQTIWEAFGWSRRGYFRH